MTDGIPLKDAIETEDAFESVDSKEAGLVKGVKLLGLTSRNRRNYDTPGVRSGAKDLLEGALVYIDHPEPEKADKPRSYRDKFGVVENVRYRSGHGHFGDIRFNPEHVCAKQFAWDVSNSPKSLGMSINARFKPGKTKGNVQDVESLEEVRSVDVVTKPATTRGIFEHETPEEDEVMDLKTLREKHPELIKQAVEEESKTATESAELIELRKKAKETQDKLDALEAEQAKTKLRTAVESEFKEVLKDTGLAEDVLKDIFECACSASEETRKQFKGVIGKLSPMLVEVPDEDEMEEEDDETPASKKKVARESEGDDDDDAQEEEKEEKDDKPKLRPGNRRSVAFDLRKELNIR